MSLALYMDENAHGAVVTQLRRRGVDVLTVVEDGREGLDDPAVLSRATELGRLLFSQDDDLLREATARQERGEHFAGVAYGHKLRISIGEAVESLGLIATDGVLADFAERIEYLPL